jgi:hypothetical protein
MKSVLRAATLSALALSVVSVTTHAQAPAAPTGLTQQVVGNLVTISWNGVVGAVAYIVQVGTVSGASNVFNARVGDITGASGSLPSGAYFWRVIAVGPSGDASLASAESQFSVGAGGPCVAPGSPQSLTANVASFVVSLFWTTPSTGTPPFTYTIEAGSSSGQANLAVLPTGSSATQFSTAAPAGIYFVRLRAQNACGVSPASTEQVVTVGINAGPSCTYAISPAQINAPTAGGPIQVNVAAPGGCRWQLTSDPYIVPTSPASGSGSATVVYDVLATVASRTGRVSIAGVDPGPVTASEVMVRQTVDVPTSCGVTLNPTSQTVGPEPAEFSLDVTANAGCLWSGTSTVGFITVVSAGSRSGSGRIVYRVDANPAHGTRTGALRVDTPASGSQDLAITQMGSSPLTASFVLRQQGSPDGECHVSVGIDGNVRPPSAECVLDASASEPADQIASYEWQTDFSQGLKDDSGEQVELEWDCTDCSPGQEQFSVTLIVRGFDGQTAAFTLDDLTLVRTATRQRGNGPPPARR